MLRLARVGPNLCRSLRGTRDSRVLRLVGILRASALQNSNLAFGKFGDIRGFASQAQVPSKNGELDFLLTDIGEGTVECEILAWHVKPGDKIAQFDRVCDVQTDKANTEITSRYDGVVKALHYKPGDMAKVGTPLLTIVVEGSSPEAHSPEQKLSVAPASPLPSPQPTPVRDPTARVLASPAAKRMMKELKLDISLIPASGKDGTIITKEDVTLFIEKHGTSELPPPKPIAPKPAQPQPKPVVQSPPPVDTKSTASVQPTKISVQSEDKVVPISGLQRVMVQTMTAANAIPQFGYGDEILCDELVKIRAQVKPLAEEAGVKLSYLAFIIKATSLALLQYPMINAHVNGACTEVIYKASHNIGLAMDTPRGLLVPNIKNVQEKNILEIAREINRLSDLGQKGKLAKEDLSGGTLTLSNIGTIGGTYCKPILVVPEAVIGALGKFQTLPRYNSKKELYPATIMQISWSADHRVLDGATVARFSNLMKHYIENPTSMIIAIK